MGAPKRKNLRAELHARNTFSGDFALRTTRIKIAISHANPLILE
jgi:hypothetical protein